MLSIRSTSGSTKDSKSLKKAFLIAIGFILLLWVIQLINFYFKLELYKFGVFPNQLFGLIGIFTAPLIHVSFQHLISNTPTLLILGTLLLYAYPRSCWIVITMVWLITEVGVWLTARPVYHLGSSGLAYGMMTYIFVIGILRRDKLAITLSLLVFFLYGTMIWGIFPHQPGISYETHLWGGGTGILCAMLFRNLDPMPPMKRYTWEDEEQTFKMDDGDINGDNFSNNKLIILN